MAVVRRRSFLALALGLTFCGAAVAQSSVKADGELSGMTDAYLTKMEQKDLSVRHDEIAAIHTASQVRERQAYIEKTLLREIGGLPERTPLHAQITGTVDRPGYQIQKLVYQSLPHFYVTADVYVPKNARPGLLHFYPERYIRHCAEFQSHSLSTGRSDCKSAAGAMAGKDISPRQIEHR
jgi:hypothetical protein